MRSVAWESHFTITESPGSASGTGGADLRMRDTGCHPSLSSRDGGKLEYSNAMHASVNIQMAESGVKYGERIRK